MMDKQSRKAVGRYDDKPKRRAEQKQGNQLDALFEAIRLGSQG